MVIIIDIIEESCCCEATVRVPFFVTLRPKDPRPK